MVNSDNEDGLPPDWKPDDLAETVRNEFGIGSDNDLPSKLRFIRNVAQVIRRRIALGIGSDPKEIAIFLLLPAPPERIRDDCKRVPMLNNGATALSGKLWFVSEVVAAGYFILIEKGDDDDAKFQFVADKIGEGRTPAMIFDPRLGQPEVRYYPDGLDKPDKYKPVMINNEEVSLADIFNAMEITYCKALVTPQAQGRGGRIWANARKGWPTKEAEVRIQYALKLGLNHSFPTCTIREEQGMPVGRLDLEVEQADALDRTKITRHAIMELKVLRSFTERGNLVPLADTLSWIKEGVAQAAEYRDDRRARQSALCCFDMRKTDTNDTCFDHVKESAMQRSVVLRRWFLYSSAKALREARAA